MRAIGDIDDAYLAEADPAQLLSAPQTASAPRRRAFHAARWGALAAGVCLLLLLPLVWRFVGRGGMTAKEDVSFAPAADGFRDGEALSGAQPAETAAAAALTTAPTTTAAAAETSGADVVLVEGFKDVTAGQFWMSDECRLTEEEIDKILAEIETKVRAGR